MQIVSIELQNYRSHLSSKFEFDEGVNLLIGKNGAGKSSILEAMGLALFNASTRSSISSAVMEGKKNAFIKVNFIGNDELLYCVERKIGSSSSWRFFNGESKTPIAEGSSEVLRRVRDVTCIKENEDRIFLDVICAVQNKFTEIFSQTETNRETTFNRLFDTDIYRNMFDNFVGRDSIDSEYNKELIKLKERVHVLSGQLVDVVSLEDNIKQIKEEKHCLEQDLDERNTLLNQDVAREKELTDTLLAYNQNIKSIESKKSEAEQLEKHIKMKKSDLKSAEGSLLVVEKEKVNYDNYTNIQKRIDEHLKSIEDEIKIRSEITAIERDLKKSQKYKLDIENKIKELTFESDKSSERITILKEEILLDEKKKQNLSDELESITSDGLKLREKLEKYETLLNKVEALEKNIMLLTAEKRRLESDCLDINSIEKDINQTEQKLNVLESKIGLLNDLKFERQRINDRIEELISAKAELAGGLCPIFKEKCKNVPSKDQNIYFDERRNELDKSLIVVSGKIDEFLTLPDDIDKLKNIKSELKKKISDTKRNKVNLDLVNERMQIKRDEISVTNNKLKLVDPDKDIKDYKEYKNFLQNKIAEARGKYKSLSDNFNYLSDELDKKRNELNSLSSKMEDLSSQKNELEKNLGEGTRNIEDLLKTQETFLNRIKEIDIIRNTIDTLMESQKKYHTGYERYIQHREQAVKRETFRQQLDEFTRTLKAVKNDIEAILDLVKDISRNELEKNIKIAQDKISKQREFLSSKRESLAKLNTELEHFEADLNKQKEQRVQIKFVEKNISRVSRKIELTDIFRKNLKEMGRFVASAHVKRIAFQATEYFRKITGSEDEILWEVGDKEKYSVLLTYGKRKSRREFKLLSGGEQVAVALALRTAMAQELSTGDFMILDEPTINLDAERKLALAESIKSMLGTLKQTIIVTHDDIFREMAQKVIEISP